MTTVKTTKAPNLVVSERDYSTNNESQFRNQLRLYFNTVDTLSREILIPNGGANFSNPHIAASHNDDQYADGDNTPTLVLWDTADSTSGFTLNANSTATAQYSGVYKIDYSIQLSNTANVALDTQIWLQVNGVDVPRSSSIFTLRSRKSVGVNENQVAYSSIVFEVLAGQSLGLWWAVEQAYESGVQDGVFMFHQDAITSPYTAPSNPSAIGSITFVGRI